LLWLTQQVGNYFAKGDTQVFQTIQFDLKTPTKADQSIVQFIQHVNRQKALTWGTWETVDSPEQSDSLQEKLCDRHPSLFEHEKH
jgi:hypothetical protein